MVTVTRQTQETVSSPQGHIPSEMSKTRTIEGILILITEEEHSFFILHIDTFTDQTAGRQMPMVLLTVKGNDKITLNSPVFLIVAWKSLLSAGKFA